ncbi:uncharacterized protein RSE6_00467 [Rhynchosporium secalis]|uniref:Uncharacterized protein n=1 Tax=Rhynchosporium secalis TaxID=38038 RepID=A0A1E1LVF2_RHYSE|nr:uncharacterized protein RSE6_00467 [Rhynchosporium secalis]
MQRSSFNKTEMIALYPTLKVTLGSIWLLFSPLVMESLAELLGKQLVEVKGTLHDLHTILSIPEETLRPIRLHHPTCRDFLLDMNRCADPVDWVDENKLYRVMADCCLTSMEKELKDRFW